MLRSLYEGSVKLGRMSPEQAKQCLSLLKPTVDYQQAKDADIVSVLFIARGRVHITYGRLSSLG